MDCAEKRWFLTVDWCNKGRRGIFCDVNGNAYSKETQHMKDEMWQILGAFAVILNPKSILFSRNELKEYCLFSPLAEYSNQYGMVCKDEIEAKAQRKEMEK